MTTVAITGGYGFLGWHTACRLRALRGVEPVRLGRAEMSVRERLQSAVAGVDTVLHIAGINRADSDREVEHGNIALADALADAVRKAGKPVDVVYANSVQARFDNAYGRGKAEAAIRLREAVGASGGQFADLMLPNLFGEHGRPGYNSFVATFAHEVVSGRTPRVAGDREIELLHAQDAAAAMLDAIGQTACRSVAGTPVLISDVLTNLESMRALYVERGEIPELTSPLRRDLFNTLRAAAFPKMWPIYPELHSDPRGDLFEAGRMHGGTGMNFASITRPTQKRGEHYHLRKIERFVVIQGEAEINLRRLLYDEVVSFRVGGSRPAFVDMPTMWVHNIRNVGSSDLVTMFWSDQLLNPETPDQFPETVIQEVAL